MNFGGTYYWSCAPFVRFIIIISGGGYQSIGSYRGEERNMGGFMVNQDGGGGGGYAAYPGASQSPGGDGRKVGGFFF